MVEFTVAKTRNMTSKPEPTNYPKAPHIIGLDWIELPVRRPVQSAVTYGAIGFQPRPTVGKQPRMALGGAVISFKRANGNGRVAGITIQAAVDDVDAKRRQIEALGLKPGPLKTQPRGDRGFEWRDPDGHTVRFVGPARQASDKTLH